ncbi:hypothetical protein JCM10212_001044 [Sporobolomyces blumeae]
MIPLDGSDWTGLRTASVRETALLIQVLLVPVHPIQKAKFDQYARLVSEFSSIALADVPPDRRGERAIFSSSPTTPGCLLLEYQTPASYAPSHPLAFLSDLQPHRRIQGIIGILDATEYRDRSLGSALTGFQNALKDLPKTFATKVYGFDPSEAQLDEGRSFKESEGMVMVPGEGDVSFFLKTLLADFASEILWEFSNMAAQLESRTSIPTPQEVPASSTPFAYASPRPQLRNSSSSYTSPPTPTTANSPLPPIPTNGQPSVNLAALGIAPPPQSRTALGTRGGSVSGNQHGFLYGSSIATNMQATQPSAAPSPPPGAGLVDQRARKRVAGREKKLMGDLWLLSGRIPDAISSYNEALLLTKSWQDQVWQASALEGLCVALVLQATMPKVIDHGHSLPAARPRSESPAIPTVPDISTFLSSIPDRLSQAVSLYEKMLPPLDSSASTSTLDPDRSHPLVYVEAALRCAYFLLAVFEAHGTMSTALDRLATPRPLASVATDLASTAKQAGRARLASLSPSNPIPRSSIAHWIGIAYSPRLSRLAPPHRVRMIGEVADLFGRLGYRRKEAFVLRELAALRAEEAVGGDYDGLATQRVGPGGIPLPSLSSPVFEETKRRSAELRRSLEFAPVVNGYGSSRSNGRFQHVRTPSIVQAPSPTALDHAAIVRLSERVCEAFGIRLAAGPSGTGRAKANKRMSLMQGKALEVTEKEHAAFGWPELQVGVLRESMMIAEALPNFEAAVRFTVTALRTLSDTTSPAAQSELVSSILRIFDSASRRGVPFELEYWGPTQLVTSLDVVPLAPHRVPTEHPLRDATANAPLMSGPRNPFIWDPRLGMKKPARVRPTLVQYESTEVLVTLHNPFLFELEIQSIELSTSGVAFAADSLSTSIPPGTVHTLRLTGTCREPGTLVIRGCRIRLAGCPSREFVLPVWNEEEQGVRKRASMLDPQKERIKAAGLEAMSTASTTQIDPTADAKFLECVVVPTQPLVWMKETSLAHGALALFDGETSTIRIELENTTTTPIDYVNLSFTDSLSQSISAYLADRELPASDVHELESEGLHRPVFSWSEATQVSIAPGATYELEVKCLGKLGCGSGTIQIDYGHLDRDIVHSTKRFHTRRVNCDVFFTVHRAVAAHTLDISRLRALPEAVVAHGRSASVVSLARRGAKSGSKDRGTGQQCLVAIEITNLHPKAFEVKLERSEHHGDVETTNVCERIEPGATLRMLVRLDRISMDADSRPIPALSERQFVVAKVPKTKEEERLERELFWYREELLQRISMTWREIGGQRTGVISLRHFALDLQHLEYLRAEEILVDLSLGDNPAAAPHAFQLKSKGFNLTYDVEPDEFVDVCATIRNTSSLPRALTLRLDLRPPSNAPYSVAHLARYVIIEGVSPVSLPVLAPGAAYRHRVTICLLAKGRFEFGCVVEEKTRQKSSRWEADERLVLDVE